MSEAQAALRPRAVVLGGYGLIGAACLRALSEAGFDVTGVGRDARAARRVAPDAAWLIRDIAQVTAAQWARDLEGVDVVVNASGALQDGARDDLEAIHQHAIAALVEGLKGRATRVIQISAAGVSQDADTPFFATKARGDAILMQSPLNWVVLRPTLVLGRAAYGGTALLRAAAAMPWVGFRVLPEVPIQTVALSDLTAAVVQAAKDEIPGGTLADLTAPDIHSLASVTDQMRRWLGLPAWGLTFNVPAPLLHLAAKTADLLGWLGWRSPLRSTALSVLQDGVRGDPGAWEKAGGAPCRSLPDTLAAMPAHVQDRWFARLFLLLPAAIGTLSLFWLMSGMIGLLRYNVAADVLISRDVAGVAALLAVLGGAVIDLILGTAILFRRHARAACLGMIIVSTGYLLGGTLLTPGLWADPLGPLVKVLPGMALAALTAALMDDR